MFHKLCKCITDFFEFTAKFMIGKHITDYKFTRKRVRYRTIYISAVYISGLLFVSLWIAVYDKRFDLNKEYEEASLIFGHPECFLVTVFSIILCADLIGFCFHRKKSRFWVLLVYTIIFILILIYWILLSFSVYCDEITWQTFRSDILTQDQFLSAVIFGCLGIVWAFYTSIDREFVSKYSDLHNLLKLARDQQNNHSGMNFMSEEYLNFYNRCLVFSMSDHDEFKQICKSVELELKKILMFSYYEAKHAIVWWPEILKHIFKDGKDENGKKITDERIDLETEKILENYDKLNYAKRKFIFFFKKQKYYLLYP